MNIFVVDEDPEAAARALCDKHVVKMPLETAQMLCTVGKSMGMTVPYMATHAKHPCTLWIAKAAANAEWAVYHGLALCQEYTRRYGKTHASEAVIMEVADVVSRLPTGSRTPFAQAMPEQYYRKYAVDAYRAYMVAEKTRFAKWKAPASRPDWWTEPGNP